MDGESLLDPDSDGAEDYPLKPEGATVPDPEKLRRMVVGGDIVLDRGQYYMVIRRGMGIDFPLDGGYAAVTSRVPEQSAYSETGIIHQFTAERTGGAGAVRKYLSGADLTLANFENPVIRDAVYHPDATTFTGDLRLMPVLDQAGIDGVTLGNNHILDAGTTGLDETMGHLDDAGIAHAGAGMDLAQARKPMIFDVGGTKDRRPLLHGRAQLRLGLGHEVGPWHGAAPSEPYGGGHKALAAEKVDLVVVSRTGASSTWPPPSRSRWTSRTPRSTRGPTSSSAATPTGPRGSRCTRESRSTTASATSCLDQSWSEETSTAIFADVTLYGDDVVQTRPVPFIILDRAQPNFLTPRGEGTGRCARFTPRPSAPSSSPTGDADARVGIGSARRDTRGRL